MKDPGMKTSWNYQLRVFAGVMTLACGLNAVSAQPIQWTPSSPLNSYHAEDVARHDKSPTVATDGAGLWVSMWTVDGTLYVANSTDTGATWGSAQEIFAGPNTSAIYIVHTGENWVAHWSTAISIDFISYYKSYRSISADGVVWSEPQEIDALKIGDADTDGNGNIIATAGNQMHLSSDHGASWTTSTLPSGDTVFRNVYVAALGNNKWLVVTDGYAVSENRIQLYESLDNGLTWTAPRNMTSQFNAIYDLEAHGNVVVAANHPTSAVSVDGGLTWTGGGSPYYTEDSEQNLAVDSVGNWILVRDGWPLPDSHENIVIFRSTNPAAGWMAEQTIASEPLTTEKFPKVEATGNGTYVVVYEATLYQTVRPGPDTDVKSVSSTDAGASWSAPVYVNEWHADDFPRILDTAPQVVHGENGVVIAAWRADTDSEIGSDHVMFARSEDYGATWSNSAPATPPYGTYDIDFWNYQLVYAGNNRWLIWWEPGAEPFFGDYVISEDNGFTWSAAQTFFGHAAASNRNGTMVKANKGGGNPPVYGLSRLAAGETAWEEPQYFANAFFEVIVHSGGQNWFAITSDNHLYVSSDDGRNWTFSNGTNIPAASSKFASDHNGKVMAMYATPTGTNSEYDINLVTSTDNGVSWSSPLLVETTRIYGFQDAAYLGRWGQVAYGGNDTWIAGWTKSEAINPVNNGSFLEVIVSRNGGLTWTAPQRVVQSGQQMYFQLRPSIAVADGKAVAAWDGSGDDVHYNFGLLDYPSAAHDWQLFE